MGRGGNRRGKGVERRKGKVKKGGRKRGGEKEGEKDGK